MNSKTLATSYLFRFMLLFEINRFWILSVSDKIVKCRVGWANDGAPDYEEEEEVQEIEWEIQSFHNFEDALELSEFLIEQQLISNDRVIIDREKLFDRIGWEKERYDAAVDTLLNIKVDMLDDGRKTDYFFVHF